MPRANKQLTDIREKLEGASFTLSEVDGYPYRIARLRIVQAQRRSGLVSLLAPALEEIDEINMAIGDARRQVDAALALLVGE